MEELIECRGVRLPRDSRFISAKVEKRLDRDMYETPEVLGLPKFIKRRDRVLELGSGIGFVSSYLATQLDVAQITCIEANPELCAYIERVHEANGITHASVRNAVALPDDAAWPADGTVPFYVTEPFWSSSMTEPRSTPSTLTHVPALRLSDLVAELKPTVIVCDIEGGEASLFGSVDLTGVRAIYMELHTRVYGGMGIQKVFDDLHRAGFFYHQKASCADVVLFEKIRPD